VGGVMILAHNKEFYLIGLATITVSILGIVLFFNLFYQNKVDKECNIDCGLYKYKIIDNRCHCIAENGWVYREKLK
jgi:hypothetical protein